ncbi:protein kinase [Geodermatophilus sp. SYSU D00697]
MTTVERGRQILGDRYELEQLIATGGMGEVWRGHDHHVDRPVAVKVLRSQYADNPTFAARFRAEARHAAALRHPNIAAVLDYGETTTEAGENVAYLVMELVEGAPLSERLAAEGRLSTQTALSVLEQAAAGLAEAHRAGVVHRDVKPANILVRDDGAVKLTDFGIAWSAGSVPLTRTGQVIGTPQYMSPEQAQGQQAGPASDVYALGLVGYESLTGHAAFEGDNPVTLALKQVQEQPEPLPADLPAGVRELIDSALAKDPEARLADGSAFLSAVEGTIRRQVQDTAARTRPVGPALPPVPHGSGTPKSPPPRPRRRRALVLVLALALVPLLVLLVVGVLAALRDPSDGGGATGAVPSPSASTSASADVGVVLDADQHRGRPVDEVVAELSALGLLVERLDQVTADSPPGTVTRVDPVGTPLHAGDRVQVHVAVAPAPPPAEVTVEEPAGTGGTPGPAEAGPPSRADDAAPAPEEAPVRTAPESPPGADPTAGTPTGAGTDTVPAPGTAPGTAVPGTESPPAPSDTTDPAPAEDGAQGTTSPGTGAPEAGTTEPDATEPDATEPDATEPDATEPDATEPDATGTGAPSDSAGTETPPTSGPGAPDPGSADPGSADPGSQDPGSQDPGSADRDTAESGAPGDSASSPAGETDPDGSRTD